MKKVLISLGAIAMFVVGTTIANAAPTAGYVVDYNEALSTATTAVVDVYLPGGGDETYYSLSGTIGLFDGTTNVTTTYFENDGTYVPAIIGGGANDKSSVARGNITLNFGADSDSTKVSLGENDKVGTWTLNLKEGMKLTNNLKFGKVRNLQYNCSGTVVNVNENTTFDTTASVDSATTGETFAEEGSDKATVYTVTATLKSGDKPKWYATFSDGKVKYKDATASLPNTEGNVILGLIFEGAEALSNVRLIVK